MTIDALENSVLNSGNIAFVSELYARYLEQPSVVDDSWATFFASLNDDYRSILHELKAPSWGNGRARVIAEADTPAKTSKPTIQATTASATALSVSADAARSAAYDSLRAVALIRSYRVRGHLAANLDPLELDPPKHHPELDPKHYGFNEAEYDRPIYLNTLGFEEATLRQLLQRLRKVYCGTIGVEFMHIQDPEQKQWIQERFEGALGERNFTERGKLAIYDRLVAAESFEQFLDKKYTGTKRFGLDGAEALIPGLEQILKRGSQLGLEEVVIGMPHRGRLNVLVNVIGKPFIALISEFQGNSAYPDDVQGSGDVKYHLGTSGNREFDGKTVHLSLTANPSHLEAVDPVVVGKVRAKQQQKKDTERTKIMALMLHGDAAFCGQGLVAETLALSELRGYRTGGSIHFIVNNQIGFTTAPAYSRFTPYPSDVAKAVQAPIFHVNGDDPEAVTFVARIATEFRMQFKRDVVIDMFCYRRFGHNEGDEPGFTQPLMYKTIHGKPPTRAIYGAKLMHENVQTEAELTALVGAVNQNYEREFAAAQSYKPNKADWLEGAWSGLAVATGDDRRGETGVVLASLRLVGAALTNPPADFDVNRKILRQLEAKRAMFQTENPTAIDWATAEALAFGTLLAEGVPVRLSGQDSGRGTFSQRHSVLIDQLNENRYIPLNNIKDAQANFEIIDSPLAEASVLGFDYGYSLAEPHALVVWEAQFGDFANGAQVIIDQFIASGEAKWLRMSGLVMLLPHGYEGQGPEHSSARLERYLQLCAEDNMQVVNCTTAANYFHVLRRQLCRNFRKPLIVMTPKSLLRAKQVASPLEDFGPNTSFHRVIAETSVLDDAKVHQVVLCSGKLFYDLVAERDKRGLSDIAILRLEQIYPFPAKPLQVELARYAAASIVWAQEEPENQGAWQFVDRRIEAVINQLPNESKRPRYAGRPAAASTATGLLRRHNKEQAELVDAALTVR